MIKTLINQRWELLLPEHRAARPEWPTWEMKRLHAMHARLFEGLVVYDVGTEEGDFSALLAQWVGPTGEVHLFEPNPRVWPNIKAIFEANGFKPGGCWSGFAANETRGSGRVESWPACADGPLIGDHGFCNLHERPDLPRIKLDDYAFITGVVPNAITIDCEGSEFEVLKGAEEILRAHRPTVWVSVHPIFMWQNYCQYEHDLFRFMWDLGYKHKVLDYDHEWHVEFRSP